MPERRKRKAERGVRGGAFWIVVLGLLLTGVVVVNLAVLRQNMQLDRLADNRAQLRDQNLELRSRLSRVVSPSYVDRLAQTSLGLEKVAPDQTTYIRLNAGGK